MTLNNVKVSKNKQRREKEFEEALQLKQGNCTHKNKEYYNHGYHCVCLDCGKDLD